MDDTEIPEVRLVPMGSLDKSPQAQAAAAVADAGGSPRAQIDAARAVHKQQGHKGGINYLPHTGKRQKLRALARMQAQAEKNGQ